MNKNFQGHALACLANMLWGLMAPVGKSALAEFSPLSVTTFRMLGAALCFWLIAPFFKQEKIAPRDRVLLFFASLFALVFNQGVYIFGLSLTSPIDASIVTTTLPIVTLVSAYLILREPVTRQKVLGIGLGAAGALILILGSSASGGASSGGGSNLWGNLLCLCGQISFSIYLTLFKGLSQRYSPLTLNKWMFVYASLCYLPFSGSEIVHLPWSSLSVTAMLQVGYVVVGGTFLAYICIMGAQRRLRPTVVSMYNYMQPIVATLAALLMGLGSFDLQKGLAVVLVFLGVYIVTQSKSRADLTGNR